MIVIQAKHRLTTGIARSESFDRLKPLFVYFRSDKTKVIEVRIELKKGMKKCRFSVVNSVVF